MPRGDGFSVVAFFFPFPRTKATVVITHSIGLVGFVCLSPHPSRTRRTEHAIAHVAIASQSPTAAPRDCEDRRVCDEQSAHECAHERRPRHPRALQSNRYSAHTILQRKSRSRTHCVRGIASSVHSANIWPSGGHHTELLRRHRPAWRGDGSKQNEGARGKRAARR